MLHWPRLFAILLGALAAGLHPASASDPGPAFQISRSVNADRVRPSAVALKNGGLVVAWLSNGASIPSENAIFARLYDDRGRPVGPQFAVSSYGEPHFGGYPIVAALGDGGFVVAWELITGEHPSYTFSVIARRYSANGQPIWGSMQLGSPEFYNQENYIPVGLLEVRVVGLTGSDFVVGWFAREKRSGRVWKRYVGRRITAGAEAFPAPFPISPAIVPSARADLAAPELSPLDDGNFIATWATASSLTERSAIAARRFNARAEPLEAAFTAEAAGLYFPSPRAMRLSGGHFLVAFGYRTDRNTPPLFGQRFNGAGVKVGGRVQLTGPGIVGYAVTPLTSGGFVVAQTIHGVFRNPYLAGRRFDTAGRAVGATFEITRPTNSLLGITQVDLPNVAALRHGSFAVVWEQEFEDDSWNRASGIWGRWYAK